MNTVKCTGGQIVSCELLDKYPDMLSRAIQDMSRNIVDKVICELEKGEAIVKLNEVEQIQADTLNAVELRRSISITPLVRCGECRYRIIDHGIPDGLVICAKPYTERGTAMHREDWFCADGKRKEENNGTLQF